MAIPRVFISSTYYDLKYVRNDIEIFIKNLGYDPVMHDKGGVAYNHSQTLEQSCYDELATCDIVICIIGNKYGTQSSGSNYSITMQELLNAVKQKKQIYIFILKEVDIEYNIYIDQAPGVFKPKYADNIKIHEFIKEIKDNIKNNPIETFESVSDILDLLRKQFAGLFQRLLIQEAAVTESKTLYELNDLTKQMSEAISLFKQEEEEFFQKFNCTYLSNNRTLNSLRKILGMKNSTFFVYTKDGLDEFLRMAGYEIDELPLPPYVYTKREENYDRVLTLQENLFESDGKLKIIQTASEADESISIEVVRKVNLENKDGFPFKF